MSATTTYLPGPGDNDLRGRFQPSREQLRVAAAMFRASPEDVTSVVVPVVMSEADPRPEHPGGYWLADRGRRDGAYGFPAARRAAEAAASAHLLRAGRHGLAGWVSIRPDGTWSALDGA
jgi:hypothetical protein